MYDVIICRQAKKKLLSLTPMIRVKIAEHIHRLGHDPDDSRLDVKKLRGISGYRLRIGQWRIIFERDDLVKIISIERIGARGDVYK
jgi:mRNA interferase RelE/StbE